MSAVSDAAAARMIDIAYAVAGAALPRDHRRELATAIERVWPGWADIEGAGVHRLNVSAGGGPLALLSNRTRLMLRLPRERVAQAAALEGSELQLGPCTLRVGAPQPRELRPYGTLYAHLVAADDADEAVFLQAVAAELSALGVSGRPICGRRQLVEAGELQGYSLMLDGLSPAGALRVLEAGVGRHRRWGCGIFVPHKSAVAVGV
ncbi:MAG: type I-MYXAN CRISPR-associated protein Cas6/Cmx6 [Rubrivivax sp.]|nr:type I-MYXAN CRISPR-associated protein Cas6/Cmx6 [Rubrivivax sp.]